jgi:hypothetical protein
MGGTRRLKKKGKRGDATAYERVIVTLPRALVSALRSCADLYRAGNKSGFVADAVSSHIERLRKEEFTRRMRESYAASAAPGLRIAREWEPLDEEAWALLDEKPRARLGPKRGKKPG